MFFSQKKESPVLDRVSASEIVDAYLEEGEVPGYLKEQLIDGLVGLAISREAAINSLQAEMESIVMASHVDSFSRQDLYDDMMVKLVLFHRHSRQIRHVDLVMNDVWFGVAKCLLMVMAEVGRTNGTAKDGAVIQQQLDLNWIDSLDDRYKRYVVHYLSFIPNRESHQQVHQYLLAALGS